MKHKIILVIHHLFLFFLMLVHKQNDYITKIFAFICRKTLIFHVNDLKMPNTRKILNYATQNFNNLMLNEYYDNIRSVKVYPTLYKCKKYLL